jgi:hypothetical protein
MPPSRLERDNPPPRRKSCHSCVKAKRRCDQKQPTCTRCSQRKIVCHYPSRAVRSEAQAAAYSQSPTTLSGPASGPEPVPGGSSAEKPVVDCLAPIYNAEPVNHLHQLVLPEIPAEVTGHSSEIADATSLGLALDNDDILGYGDIDPDVFFDFTGSMRLGEELAVRPPQRVPAAPERLCLARLHAALESKFSYAMNRIKAGPSEMLLENQTPWCHPLLYRDDMPRGMQGMCLHKL